MNIKTKNVLSGEQSFSGFKSYFLHVVNPSFAALDGLFEGFQLAFILSKDFEEPVAESSEETVSVRPRSPAVKS